MLYCSQKEREREVTKMTELEMFVKMMDRAKISIRIEELDKETHVFIQENGTEYIFGEHDQLVKIW